jgi:hypothetical protein
VPNNPPQGVLTGSPPIKDFAGNWVSIRIAPRRYLLYAHLVPGSVRVRTGQLVRRGQVIGLLGNSGNTSTPHLHFQVSDRPGFAPVDSLPFVFNRFALLGQITDEFTDENLALRPTGELAFGPVRLSTRAPAGAAVGPQRAPIPVKPPGRQPRPMTLGAVGSAGAATSAPRSSDAGRSRRGTPAVGRDRSHHRPGVVTRRVVQAFRRIGWGYGHVGWKRHGGVDRVARSR